MKKFDMVVIGGGVGGLVTASGAAQLGARVALVEKEKSLGGDCLHWGCVPTKRLVESARVATMARRAAEFGVEFDGAPRVNFAKVMEGVRSTQKTIARHDDPERFRKMGVEVIFGLGRFVDSRTFEVNGEKLHGKKFLICTGSSPAMPPIPGLKETGALTNVTALDLTELPASITVLGAGPIGMEFAQVFHRLGAKVTIIKKYDQILPKEELELSNALEKILTDEGIEMHICKEVLEVKREGSKKVLSARCSTGDSVFSSDELMIAIGRSPNVGGLDLEAAGVEYDGRKGIKINSRLQTSVSHIYACGDVAGPFPFTHMAEYQAGLVITNALFPLYNRSADYRVVPWVTYVDPELGRVGMTELEAVAKYGAQNVKVYRFRFEDVDRAVIAGEGHGMIKLVCDKKQRILGAHVLGHHAGELIHEYVLAMKLKAPITSISKTVHVYPTLSQAVKRAADQYYREKLFTGWLPKFTKWLIRRSG
jgi:pyruvate/2-oxoglutarate dehydrogenase complex dihydrolipoamide dehydrogenase (E3) component